MFSHCIGNCFLLIDESGIESEICRIFQDGRRGVLGRSPLHAPVKNPQYQQVCRVKDIEEPFMYRLAASAFAVVAKLN